ncbi:MAG: hypothetical protein KKD21_00640 [Proteobacteria bacterium]|nr:hypothetical protein [Pseudomonadota bacterium]MBU1695537.1 hypothetical protein [Pseudomonadota bacterium]
MFNTILADLTCAKREEIAKDSEIQIKWQEQPFRILDVYHKSICPKILEIEKWGQ